MSFWPVSVAVSIGNSSSKVGTLSLPKQIKAGTWWQPLRKRRSSLRDGCPLEISRKFKLPCAARLSTQLTDPVQEHSGRTPTYNRTNKFTLGFQTILESYGIAAYQEWAEADLGEIVGQFFFGHYIILLMGLSSMYTGLMYNDIFSKSLHLFHSGWDFPPMDGNNTRITASSNGHTYLFGLDPARHGSDNGLVFTKSYKMKLSVVLGVIHMTFALCLQIPSHLRLKRPIDIYLNFITQMVFKFLWSIFGYLVVCILYKWSIDWSTSGRAPVAAQHAHLDVPHTGDGRPRDAAVSRAGRGADSLAAVRGGVCPDSAHRHFIWREIKQRSMWGIGHGEGRANHEDEALLGEEANGNGGAVVEDADDEAYLSEVLWSMTIEGSLGPVSILGWIKLSLTGSLWFGCTVGILCLMEVEASNKHYEGGGYHYIFCLTTYGFLGELQMSEKTAGRGEEAYHLLCE
ncbi:V-type ATPase 116kDa subunit family-domain-containing protein [Mycena rebaudengoi]|nr:V-type ATPase 116kDa subunit family-domain-containing protein [Mycena rebaudengoi]